jgi:hypothetical protein
MNAISIVEEYEARDVRFELSADGQVIVDAPKGSLASADLERLRSARSAIIEALSLKSATPGGLSVPRIAAVPPEVIAEITRIESEAHRLGWSHERLWNSDFWPHTPARPRGLASILSPGDRIAAVNRDFLQILQQGKPVRFFRCDG